MKKPVNVTIFNEFMHEQSDERIRKVYPDGIHGAIAEKLRTAEKELLPDSAAKLGMMRVRTAYEAGRDSAVKNFVEQAKLLQYIKGIGLDRKAFLNFAHYMEALVAYHRYYGGKD